MFRMVLQTGDEVLDGSVMKADLAHGGKQRKFVDHVPLLEYLVDLS